MIRRRSRDVIIPTTLPRAGGVLADWVSTTIIPERPFSMHVCMEVRTVASFEITGSTHRSVCFALSTSDIGTYECVCVSCVDVEVDIN